MKLSKSVGRVSISFLSRSRRTKQTGQTSQTQIDFGEGWTVDRLQENKFINDVRERVCLMATSRGYQDDNPSDPTLVGVLDRSLNGRSSLFFCQIEAIETAIYITEVAHRDSATTGLENELLRVNEMANPLLFRIAFKMATGSGKTVVMAMLIAWHTLNKLAQSKDGRFSDAFLIVTPGITIRDRLRVLIPNDPDNYYVQRDILPPDSDALNELGQAKIVITNFHAFLHRSKDAGGQDSERPCLRVILKLSPKRQEQMVRRVLREFGGKQNIIVLNDEAHHCYRRKSDESYQPYGRRKKRSGKAR